MNNIIKDFPNRFMIKIANALMLDNEVNKALYYNNELDKDIYSLPEIENPVSELKDHKVFIDRRIDEIRKEGDIALYINLYRDNPYEKNYKKSRFIKTCKIEIGVICHKTCRKTLNGNRDLIVIDRAKNLLKNDRSLRGIGENNFENTQPMYNMPYEYNGYLFIIETDYFGDM